MNITIATGLYPPEIGGPATYAAMLETELPAQGITVSIVPFGWVRHYPKIIRHIIFAWKLWQESKQADIIYALDPMSVGLPALWVAHFRRKPFLIRLGGDYAWEQGRIRFGVTDTLDDYLAKRATSPWQVKLFAKIQTYVVSHARRVIVPSEYLKTVVMKWGINEDSIQVIYSALYPLEVNETREALRHRLLYAYPTIVSAGRLVPWKGFRLLIQIVAELRQHYPEISLVIVGDGDQQAELEALVEKLDIKQNVRFAGSVTKETLGAIIKAADVFVLNTAYEGLSHQLIEVMDIGTPIVTTSAGGNVELITNGVNGFLVEFNNAQELTESINYILNHPEARERITQSARGRSKKFSKETVILEIVAMLQEIHDQTIA
jgi:glycosyltransferase involved in cell wall biosynthesis